MLERVWRYIYSIIFSPYLECLNKYKDVIDSDGQHQERDDLNDDESGRETDVTEESQRDKYGQQHYRNTRQPQRDLRVNLEQYNTWLAKSTKLKVEGEAFL